MGFEVAAGGVWYSETGISLIVRVVDAGVVSDRASRFAHELASARIGIAGPDSSVLFVTDGQAVADVFRTVISHDGLNDRMRTVSASNLGRLADLVEAGSLDHTQALMILAPIADIDPGEIISVLNAARDA